MFKATKVMIKSIARFSTLICVLIVFTSGCFGSFAKDPSIHLAMGNPSNATVDTTNSDNFLMRKEGYALSYNRNKGIPNWVSWQLDQNWIAPPMRTEAWSPDLSLPEGWSRVTPNDYRGSGYDRGHMTPAADRSKNETVNAETFLMTNILPQAADNNRGPWRELEEYSRELVAQGKALYIIAGGVGQKKAIARGKVSVPERVWKIIVVLDKAGQGAGDVSNSTRIIAVDMPNRNGISSNWQDFRTSVDKLETATGYDFLSNVSYFTQLEVESKVDGEAVLINNS